MAELIEAGADAFRLNFSHGTREEHVENVERARRASRETGREIALIGDLPGPKLRLSTIRVKTRMASNRSIIRAFE